MDQVYYIVLYYDLQFTKRRKIIQKYFGCIKNSCKELKSMKGRKSMKGTGKKNAAKWFPRLLHKIRININDSSSKHLPWHSQVVWCHKKVGNKMEIKCPLLRIKKNLSRFTQWQDDGCLRKQSWGENIMNFDASY